MKWLFKKRYIISVGCDFGFTKPLVVVIKYDKKYDTYMVIQ